MRRTQLLAAILAVVPLTHAAAQPSLAPGDRVRISARGAPEQVVGTVISSSSEALVIEGENETTLRIIPLASVGQLDRSRGRSVSWSRVLTYAAVGGMAGAMTGGVGIPIMTSSDCHGASRGTPNMASCLARYTDGAARIRDATVGGAVGAALGALIGAATGKERWDEISVGRARIGLKPFRGAGTAFSLSIGF